MDEQDLWLMELIPLAEEIKHGKGNAEKVARLSELILLMHSHLFNGGSLPHAWFIPMITDFSPDNHIEDNEESGVREIPSDDFDLSCFDEFDHPKRGISKPDWLKSLFVR